MHKGLVANQGQDRSALKGLTDFFPYLSRQRGRLAVAYGMSLIGVVLTLLLPWPLKIMIDDVLGGEQSVALLQSFSVQQQVVFLAVAMTVLASMVAIALAADKVLHARVRERFSYWLRDDLLQQLYRLSRSSRQNEMSGELTMRLVSDTQQVSRLFCKTFPMTVKHITTAVFTLVTIMLISLPIGMIALFMASSLAVVVGRYGPRLSRAAAGKREREGRVAARSQEAVNGIEHVQAMGLEEQARAHYLKEAADSLQAGVNEVRVAVGLERSSQFVAGLALALVAGSGGMAVVSGQLTLGTLTVCLAYVAQLLKPIEKINQVATSISRGVVRAERIRELFRADTVDHESTGTRAPGKIRQIQCVDLHFRYAVDAQDTVSGFSHCFREGECTMIVGRSGCGKSTLLRLILGLHSPTSGRVLLNGQDYRRVDTQAFRSQIAVLLQDSHLFAGSVREILAELRTDATDEQLWQVLAEVRLQELVNSLPQGLDAPIDESGSTLSGGQRARLLLARALVSQRSVLILDEPFANLDAESRRIIQRRISHAKRDHIVIIVSHEQALLEAVDHVLTPHDYRSEQPTPTSCRTTRLAIREANCANSSN